MTKPIALVGKMRSGKDSVAEILTRKHGYTRFAFADEMKRLAAEMFPSEFRDNRKPRELLQWFGQTMRERDTDVWVRMCFTKISYSRYFPLSKALSPVVITDVRQQNEFDRCHVEGYVIVGVECSEAARLARLDSDMSTLNHETETALDGAVADYTIINDGTLADLERKVDELMAELAK